MSNVRPDPNVFLGISGMTMGPDGKTLVVAIPAQANGFGLGDTRKRGNVLVFDLSTLQFNGDSILQGLTVDQPIVAELPQDTISGKSPQTITAFAVAAIRPAPHFAAFDFSFGLERKVRT